MHGLPEDRSVIVLAAGASRRFAGGDKLLAPIRGRPLVEAAFARASELPFASRIAVVSNRDVARLAERAGLTPRMVAPGLNQSDSLKAGIPALPSACRFALILLGDMPFVDPSRLAEIALHERPACATLDGRPMPPVLIPRTWFDDIRRLSGDRGAGPLLSRIAREDRFNWSARELTDIDDQSQLAAEHDSGAFAQNGSPFHGRI